MATYKTSKEAVAKAITGHKNDKTKKRDRFTKSEATKTAKAKNIGSSSCANLSAARTGDVGSGNLQVVCRWTCSTGAGQIDHFDLDIEYWSSRRAMWVQLNNNTISVGTTSVANGYYTYYFNAPSDTDVASLRFHVIPRSKNHDVKITYYAAEKIKSGKNKGEYKVVKKSEKISLAYFTSSWSGWAELSPAPALQDSQDAEEKLKVARPDRPSKPSATLLSNNAIDVTFNAIDTSTAASARVVYRCMDGAYTSAGSDRSGLITTNGTTHFVDSDTAAGHEYRYYLRSVNTRGKKTWDAGASLPADLCDAVKTPPVQVTGLKAECYGDDGAKVSFSYPSTAYFPALSSVKVYYANDRSLLTTNTTSNSSVDVTRGSRSMSAIITGLDAGYTWYFAVWLKTGDSSQCELFCSSVASCKIATIPEAPTIGSVPRAAYVGDSVKIEWTHNNADGSPQEAAKVYVTAKSGSTTTYSHEYTVGTDESYTLQLSSSNFSDMNVVSVKVKTKGAANSYGPYSEDVQLTVYAKPNASMTIADADDGTEGIQVTSLPVSLGLSVSALSGTLSQSVVQWRVVISALESFVYKDAYGNDANMAAGETVSEITLDSYEDDFSQPTCTVNVGATQAVFMTGVSYRATVYALMNSGLEAEPFSQDFSCDFESAMEPPSAMIVPMPDWSAQIYPMLVSDRTIGENDDYLIDVDVMYLAALESTGVYEVIVSYTDEEGSHTISEEWDGSEAMIDLGLMGDWLSVTSVGYRIAGSASTPTALTGSAYSTPQPVSNVLLSVYRIDQDGSMHMVCQDYPNATGIFVVDRHPSFGDMTYRVVANSTTTDEISVCDVSSDNEWKSILIQWDENEDSYTSGDEQESGLMSFAFEFVELPWNISVNQSSSKDVAYKNYVGRTHPVGLWGTHVGEKGSWSCEIVKDQEDLELVQLRKLAAWMGECWVREPSGLSYPANVDVSITRQYDSMAVSVQLEVTRVDGD